MDEKFIGNKITQLRLMKNKVPNKIEKNTKYI